MIITISGQAGSGKSTVARLIARKRRIEHFSMGDMRRKLAAERGMTLAELNRLGESEVFTDRDVDEFQKKLGEERDDFVVDGRTSWHFIPRSLKVYLDAEPGARAARVFHDERSAERFATVEEAEKALQERETSDRLRYLKYYGIDVHDPGHYDLVIDTTLLVPEEIAEAIIEHVRRLRA